MKASKSKLPDIALWSVLVSTQEDRRQLISANGISKSEARERLIRMLTDIEARSQLERQEARARARIAPEEDNRWRDTTASQVSEIHFQRERQLALDVLALQNALSYMSGEDDPR